MKKAPVQTTVCEIDSLFKEGGVARAIGSISEIIESLGYRVLRVPYVSFHTRTFRVREVLSNSDIVHVHGFPSISLSLILILAAKPKKILTLHGWQLYEAKILSASGGKPIAKRILGLYYNFLLVAIQRLILVPFVYDVVTCVSKTTALRNGVKAIEVPNCIDPAFIDEKVGKCVTTFSSDGHEDEVRFIAYVSRGGGKILAIPTLEKLIRRVNNQLQTAGEKTRVRLTIFGSDIPTINLSYHTPFFEIKEYSENYLAFLKQSDLMLLTYSYPELESFAGLEAGYLKVPLAKFTDNLTQDEIQDGVSGILATNVEEMSLKLARYAKDVNVMKITLSEGIFSHIMSSRICSVISKKWQEILESLSH